jgi:preprotein translocase subunit SecE
VKNTIEENAVSNDILKLPNGLLELEKPFKLFDMKKFQQNVNREMKRTYPDRRKLENQCISAIAFVRNEPELLDSPIWIMLINIVALEMLRVKLPAGKKVLFVFVVVVVTVTFDVIVLMLRKSLLWSMLIDIVALEMLRVKQCC